MSDYTYFVLAMAFNYWRIWTVLGIIGFGYFVS